MRTIILLTISNIFMTFAWYGHLKYRTSALWKVILVSWGIAFFEYCFQVPGNRIGSYEFTTAQLKTIQEVITLSVFSAFSVLYLGEKIKWNYAAGFGCIALAVFFVFHKWLAHWRRISAPIAEAATQPRPDASQNEAAVLPGLSKFPQPPASYC
jgi:uncharacterized protein